MAIRRRRRSVQTLVDVVALPPATDVSNPAVACVCTVQIRAVGVLVASVRASGALVGIKRRSYGRESDEKYDDDEAPHADAYES